VATEQRRAFDLAQAPLMTCHLIALSTDHHVLVWTVHHLISDGWSTSVVLDDVLRRYEGGVDAVAAPARFRDILSWVRKTKRGTLDRSYWTQHFDGLDAPTRLELAPPGATLGTGHGRIEGQLDADVSQALNAAARALRVTPNTVLSTAWALVLRHIACSNDIVFGQTYAGRPPEVAGADRAAGAFVNTLPLRVTFDPAAQISQLLTQVERMQRAHAAHEFAALHQVQSCAPVPKGSPLFETVFVSEGIPQARSDFGPLTVTDRQTLQSSNYQLALLVTPGDTVRYELYHDRAKVAEPLARAIFDRFAAVLVEMLRDTDQRVEGVLPAAVPAIVVPEATAEPGIVEHFLRQAAAIPDASAVCDEGRTLSYGALRERAESVAAALVARGVQTGDVVPVALPRLADTLAAYLGVWMAGAAYVPLDLTYPSARLAQMLETVQPRHVLANRATLERLPVHDANVLLMDALDDAPPVPQRCGPLAYVMFTSGSQGRPKGVMISHAALAHSTAARDAVYGVGPDAYLVLSSLAFDSAVPGLFWPLVHGGTVVIAPAGAEQDPAGIAQMIRHHRISHTLCLPRVAQAFLPMVETSGPFKTLICAGEPLDAQRLTDLRQHFMHGHIFNEYGPTEATVWATVADVTLHQPEAPVPIGAALPGTWAGVCDLDGAPLPRGALGEINICGPILANGYLSAPDQTASAFRSACGALPRRYKTGDLGQATAAGVLIYRGRIDRQVKIRGQRVELSEVESAARPLVAAPLCAVQTTSGALALAIEGPAASVTAIALREHLQTVLPLAYVPSIIEHIPAFPTLPNGKTDTATLSRMIEQPVPIGPAPLAPRTEIEGHIADIFAEVTGIAPFPVDGHFFDLGGDSLKTLKAFDLGRKGGLSFAPNDIFDHPTPARLARHMLTLSEEWVPSERIRNVHYAHQEGDAAAVFLVHGSMPLFSQISRGLGARHPIAVLFSHHLYGTHVPLSVRVEDLAKEAIGNLHQLRKTGPYVLCAYSAGAPIALEMARVLGDEVAQVFLIDPPYQLLEPTPWTAEAPAVDYQRRLTRRALRFRVLRHMARVCALFLMSLLRPASEKRRKSLVRSAYVFSLSRYRIKPYDRPVQVLVTPDNPAMNPGSVLDRYLRDKETIALSCDHRALLDAPENVVAVAARIVARIKAADSGQER
ncbi:MAG: amino acid adenylation domain-containing protein, partial [Pseudomonadota bacterium]